MLIKRKAAQRYGKVGLRDKPGKSGTVPPKSGLLIGMMVSPVIVCDTKPHILGIWDYSVMVSSTTTYITLIGC